MKIRQADWERYRDELSRISDRAAAAVENYIWKEHNGLGDVSAEEIIEYSKAVIDYYSDASSELACQMYDEIAAVQNANVPPAEPAESADYNEVAKAINGVLKQSPDGNLIGDPAARLTKRAAADTMLQNAKRDGAEFAWIPSGDGCAFCRMLASRGWQRASKKTVKGDHAEHIHANCKCQFAIRFDGKSTVEGYDPDKLLDQYNSADGDTWQEKLNSMRREQYAERRNIAYSKNGDPIYDIFGPIKKSNPEEINRITDEAAKLGVEIRNSEHGGTARMGYSPGLHRGNPGQLMINDEDSIGAWLHEEQHMLDDAADGFPGFAGLFDVERRAKMEYNAYKKEIELARENNREDIAKKLVQLCKEEIEGFGGDWDEKKLE